jgi:hypothetical protein
MKAGRTLSELAAELERQTSTRKDYIAPQGKLEAVPAGNDIEIHGINGGLTVTPYAHGQLSSHLGIPKAYYDRMKQERPELLAKKREHLAAGRRGEQADDPRDRRQGARGAVAEVPPARQLRSRVHHPAGPAGQPRPGDEQRADGNPDVHQGHSAGAERRAAGRHGLRYRAPQHPRGRSRPPGRGHRHQQQRSGRRHAARRAERVHDLVYEPRGDAGRGDEEVPRGAARTMPMPRGRCSRTPRARRTMPRSG